MPKPEPAAWHSLPMQCPCLPQAWPGGFRGTMQLIRLSLCTH